MKAGKYSFEISHPNRSPLFLYSDRVRHHLLVACWRVRIVQELSFGELIIDLTRSATQFFAISYKRAESNSKLAKHLL